MEFEIRVEEVQRRVPITIFHLSGSMNLGNADVFDQAGREAVQRGTHHILLDFKDVPAVRSAGLHSIQILYKLLTPAPAATQEGNPPESPYLKLANMSPEVLYVFEVAGFLRNIGSYDDIEAALNSFG